MFTILFVNKGEMAAIGRECHGVVMVPFQADPGCFLLPFYIPNVNTILSRNRHSATVRRKAN